MGEFKAMESRGEKYILNSHDFTSRCVWLIGRLVKLLTYLHHIEQDTNLR